MAKSKKALRKKPGRAATRQDSVTTVRLPPELKSKIGAWANRQDDRPALPAAIRRLLEKALASTSATRRLSKGAARKATEMAAREIDRVLGDQPATGEERASRKRRLLAGPKEFRGIPAQIIAPTTDAEIVPMKACGIKKHGAGKMP